MVKKLFLDGVSVEPADRAQSTRDRRTCSAAAFDIAAEALNVCTSSLQQVQIVLLAPGGEHPQVERVGVACQAAIAGKKPSQSDPLALGEQRLDRRHVGRSHGGGHGDLQNSG